MTKYVVQYSDKFKKTIAIDLRKKGFSYSEIQKKVSVPKSTLSFWLKNIKLEDHKLERLEEKKIQTLKQNIEKRSLSIQRSIESIKLSSEIDLGKISKRELWLMGIILYWRESISTLKNNDLKNGVHFSNSNPDLIRFFLHWLKSAGQINEDEIIFTIFTPQGNKKHKPELIKYWANICRVSADRFQKIYYQKNYKKVLKDKSAKVIKSTKPYFGFLRIKVRSSSMMARQLEGWINGIKNVHNK